MTDDSRVVIITGAASGIGEATARLLARRGHRVVLAGRRAVALQDVADSIRDADGEVLAVPADVSEPADVQRVVDLTLSTYGGLHWAVNNAGVAGTDKPLHEVTVEEWDEVLAVDLSGAFYAMRAQIPAILASGGGAIVNVSSVYADRGLTVDYSAAKHGLRGLTRSAAKQYGPHGIRVNELQPGVVWTDMSRANPEGARWVADHGIPLQRIAEPDEIATAIAFLLSDDARYVSGAHLAVDGGFLA